MQRLLLSLSVILLSSHISAQVTVMPGTTMVVKAGTTVMANQDVAIADGGTLANEGNFVFKGDLSNSGTAELTGRIEARGDDEQIISGADSFAIRAFTINNSAGVRLESKVAITDNLALDRGVLFTSEAYPVYFVGNSSNPNETVDGYIHGTAILDTRYSNEYRFNFLGAELNIASLREEIGMIGIKRITGPDAVLAIGNNTSIAASWEVYNESPSLSTEYGEEITVSWLPAFDNGKSLTDLILYGTSELDKTKFVMLDNPLNNALSVNATTGMRVYHRKNINFINRVFTLAGEDVLLESVPPVNITTFPNPATDHVTFLLQNFEPWATNVRIKITDAYGKLFADKIFKLDGNLITMNDLGFLPTGVYRAFISRGQLTKVINFVKTN